MTVPAESSSAPVAAATLAPAAAAHRAAAPIAVNRGGSVASVQPSAARPPLPGVIGGPSLAELSAEVDRFEEEIPLVRLRLLTDRLMDAQPGSIVFQYFSARRAMPYKGRNVMHISRTCPDLWQVRTCIFILFFISQHFYRKESTRRFTEPCQQLSLTTWLILRFLDSGLLLLPPHSLPLCHTHCSDACSRACIESLHNIYTTTGTHRYIHTNPRAHPRSHTH
jgi:hypothetical protein